MLYQGGQYFLFSFVLAHGAVLYGTACKNGNNSHYACKKLITLYHQKCNHNNFCIIKLLKSNIISIHALRTNTHAFLQHYFYIQGNYLNKTCKKNMDLLRKSK